jgi:hypothetical protein
MSRPLFTTKPLRRRVEMLTCAAEREREGVAPEA